jgi:pimeloyl-ACP methyl ester carboxylesterase/DNA-binding CsgD family transcriptional regulator
MPAEPAIKQDIRFCTAPDDVRLAYAISGDGPPLVMSIPWLTDLECRSQSLVWRPWLEAFSADHKLLSYDLRGCGLSNRNPAELSLEAWIHDFESVVDAADFKQFSILATCQHGPVAIEYAAKHPERVRKIVLYCTYARGRMKRPDRPFETEKTRVAASLLRTGWAQDDALLQIWAHAFQPGGSLEHWRSWCDFQRAATSAETATRMIETGWNVDVSNAARKIKCPVLVLHSEGDQVVPIEEGRALVSLIPGSRFIEIDSENHMPLADEPAWPRVVSDIRNFLAESAPARPAHALPLEELTPRELSVLEGIADGMDNAQLAASLGISEKTVRNHITRIFDKTNVKHRYEAIVRARDAGLGASSRLTRAL